MLHRTRDGAVASYSYVHLCLAAVTCLNVYTWTTTPCKEEQDKQAALLPCCNTSNQCRKLASPIKTQCLEGRSEHISLETSHSPDQNTSKKSARSTHVEDPPTSRSSSSGLTSTSPCIFPARCRSHSPAAAMLPASPTASAESILCILGSPFNSCRNSIQFRPQHGVLSTGAKAPIPLQSAHICARSPAHTISAASYHALHTAVL